MERFGRVIRKELGFSSHKLSTEALERLFGLIDESGRGEIDAAAIERCGSLCTNIRGSALINAVCVCMHVQ